MRRAARENVFKLIFEYSFYHKKNEDTLALMLIDSHLTDDDKAYISSTYDGVIAEEDAIKKTIADNLDAYSLERVYRPDLVVLVLAVYELNKKEVPVAVIINEAVELAKKFGTEKSGSFVNGVLAKIEKSRI